MFVDGDSASILFKWDGGRANRNRWRTPHTTPVKKLYLIVKDDTGANDKWPEGFRSWSLTSPLLACPSQPGKILGAWTCPSCL